MYVDMDLVLIDTSFQVLFSLVYDNKEFANKFKIETDGNQPPFKVDIHYPLDNSHID